MGEQLGKSVQEILQLPVQEFIDWIAYFRIKTEEEKKAIKRSKNRNRKIPAGAGF